jgi:tetratricopeptide (TPR) repeat protein
MIQTTYQTRTVRNDTDPATGINPGNAGIWNELGNSLVKVGAYDDAIDAYKNAIDIDPGYGWSYSNLAVICTLQGKLAEAVTLCKKSLRLLADKKGQAMTWARLGEAYRQLGQYEQAMAAYQAADELNDSRATQRSDFRLVDPEQINPSQFANRGNNRNEELVESIRMHGIIQPLVVCPAQGEPGKFTLISGSSTQTWINRSAGHCPPGKLAGNSRIMDQ